MLTDTHLHGISLQSVMTLCQNVCVTGSIFERESQTFHLNIMGMDFYYQQELLYLEWKDREKIAHGMMHHGIEHAGRQFRRRLVGGNHEWIIEIFASQLSPSIMWEMKAVPTTMNPYGMSRVEKPMPPCLLRWGKEGVFAPYDINFVGDIEVFKSQMVYASLMGGLSSDDWSELAENT